MARAIACLFVCVAGTLAGVDTAQAQSRSHSVHASGMQTCTVDRVGDGDSVRVRCQNGSQRRSLRLRIRGIDAPELNQPYGRAARNALQQQCLRQTVVLPRNLELDRYNRALVDLRCNGQDMGEYLVAAGLAWYYRAEAGNYPQLVRLERQAQQVRRGLWGQSNPTPPWVWRRAQAAR